MASELERPHRIYLDVCALCRPFDDQNQTRTRRIESVQRHQQWQATLNAGEFFEQVFGPRRESE